MPLYEALIDGKRVWADLAPTASHARQIAIAKIAIREMTLYSPLVDSYIDYLRKIEGDHEPYTRFFIGASLPNLVLGHLAESIAKYGETPALNARLASLYLEWLNDMTQEQRQWVEKALQVDTVTYNNPVLADLFATITDGQTTLSNSST